MTPLFRRTLKKVGSGIHHFISDTNILLNNKIIFNLVTWYILLFFKEFSINFKFYTFTNDNITVNLMSEIPNRLHKFNCKQKSIHNLFYIYFESTDPIDIISCVICLLVASIRPMSWYSKTTDSRHKPQNMV